MRAAAATRLDRARRSHGLIFTRKHGSSPQLQWIRNGLKAAESHVRRLRKADTWAIVVGTAASAGAPLTTGLHKGLAISDRLTKASACTGKLRALDLAATLGGRPTPDLARECEQVAAEYPDFLSP